MTVIELYRKQVKHLAPSERLELARWILDDLVEEGADTQAPKPRRRSLMELEGLGKEIWAGVDVESYVNELRDEWDRP
jgi:hypothetical protein